MELCEKLYPSTMISIQEDITYSFLSKISSETCFGLETDPLKKEGFMFSQPEFPFERQAKDSLNNPRTCQSFKTIAITSNN